MKNIKLTTNNGERKVMVNWDNVDFAKETLNHFGDKYTEIHCGKQTMGVKESVLVIETKLLKLE